MKVPHVLKFRMEASKSRYASKRAACNAAELSEIGHSYNGTVLTAMSQSRLLHARIATEKLQALLGR